MDKIALLNKYNNMINPMDKFKLCLKYPKLLRLFYSQYDIILCDYVVQFDVISGDIGVFIKHKDDKAGLVRYLVGYIEHFTDGLSDIPLDQFIEKLMDKKYVLV